MSDEITIAAPRLRVFEALNDVDILRQSIPGCIDLQKLSDTEMAATVMAKVGPVKAKFKGAVTLSEINPPESYRISGEGKGGAAGFAKGSAMITLIEDGDRTVLRYEVSAKVGGKLAQIGNRLVDSTARKLAGEFFKAFDGLIGEHISDQVLETLDQAPEKPVSKVPRWILTGVVSMILAAIVLWLATG
jgi:carbon monoxide dehydrogenase subunit G